MEFVCTFFKELFPRGALESVLKTCYRFPYTVIEQFSERYSTHSLEKIVLSRRDIICMENVIRSKYIVCRDHIHLFCIGIVKIFELFGQFIFSDNETREKGMGIYSKKGNRELGEQTTELV